MPFRWVIAEGVLTDDTIGKIEINMRARGERREVSARRVDEFDKAYVRSFGCDTRRAQPQ
jgi:hypothetical protein